MELETIKNEFRFTPYQKVEKMLKKKLKSERTTLLLNKKKAVPNLRQLLIY